jgi:hypothetical protein
MGVQRIATGAAVQDDTKPGARAAAPASRGEPAATPAASRSSWLLVAVAAVALGGLAWLWRRRTT